MGRGARNDSQASISGPGIREQLVNRGTTAGQPAWAEDPEVEQHLGQLRNEHPELSDSQLQAWAHSHVQGKRLQARIQWETPSGSRTGAMDPFLIGKLPVSEDNPDSRGVMIRVYEDPETYDWGDTEPTEQERNDLEVIGVGVRLEGDEEDLDNIWGVGYLHGDAQEEAVRCALDYGFIDNALDKLNHPAGHPRSEPAES